MPQRKSRSFSARSGRNGNQQSFVGCPLLALEIATFVLERITNKLIMKLRFLRYANLRYANVFSKCNIEALAPL